VVDANGDLGFSYRLNKSGDLEIYRDGRLVTHLRGKSATRAALQLETANFESRQQLLARLTGNYRRGNERQRR
jgi:hypothetical protein